MGERLRRLPVGRWQRTVVPVRLAVRGAARWAVASVARGENRQRRRERVLLHTADDVARSLGEMKGAAMKVGQVLSLMTGVVPPEMTARLSSLQSDAPPMAPHLVAEVLRDAYGSRSGVPFRRFQSKPFAAASIGQVHRAELDDGTAVAVKVQYPGIGAAIRNDLSNVGALLGLAGMISPGLDPGPILADLREGIMRELDYTAEAANQQRFFDLFAGHAFVRVPRVFQELTRPTVLVQEFLPGRPFATAVSLPQAERNRIAEMLFRFAFGSFYRHGLFNGDPHPGNYLLMPDGGVGFVDYGCVAEFERPTIDRFRALLATLYAGDHVAWRAAAEDVGILRPNAPFSTDELYEHMHWFWKPVLSENVTMTPELVGQMVRRHTMTTGEGGRINRHLNIPPGMAYLTRINFGLAGVFAGLRAEGPWRAMCAEYVFGTPPSTALGERSAATSRGPSV